MAALTFTLIANDETASQAVVAATSVALVSLSGNGFIEVYASHNDTLFEKVSSSDDVGNFGKYSGVFSMPPIPAGWSIKINTIGSASGTVAIE